MKVVPLIQLLPRAKEWATKICAKAPLGVQRAKEAMIRGRIMALEDGLSLEPAFFEECVKAKMIRKGVEHSL